MPANRKPNDRNNKNKADAKSSESKKQTLASFNCDLCNVQCSSQEIFESHVSGQRHQKKQKRKNELEASGMIEKIQNSDSYCKLCSVELTSKAHMLLHLNGRRHKQNLLKDLLAKSTGEAVDATAQVEEFERKQKQEEEDLIKRAGIEDFSKYEIPEDKKPQAVNEGAKNKYYCSLCSKFFPAKAQLAMHILSLRHKEKQCPEKYLKRPNSFYGNERANFKRGRFGYTNDRSMFINDYPATFNLDDIYNSNYHLMNQYENQYEYNNVPNSLYSPYQTRVDYQHMRPFYSMDDSDSYNQTPPYDMYSDYSSYNMSPMFPSYSRGSRPLGRGGYSPF